MELEQFKREASLVDPLVFYQRFCDYLKAGCTEIEAYEKTECDYRKIFDKNRYSSYTEFCNVTGVTKKLVDIELEKFKKDALLVERLAFYQRYWKYLKAGCTEIEAYEKTECDYRKIFDKNKYSSFMSFYKVKTKYIKVK
jgi:hypothetical protein